MVTGKVELWVTGEIGEAKLWEMFNFCAYFVMFICHEVSIMLETRSETMKLTGRSPLRR